MVTIKGEKIKDGSISLSALADDVKGKLNNIFIVPDDFFEEIYDEPDEDGVIGKLKQKYVTDILENRYNKVNSGEVLGDITITEDFITFELKHEGYEQGMKVEISDVLDVRVSDCTVLQYLYENKSPFVRSLISTDAADINGDIRYDFVRTVTDEGITVPEENKQLFKKNMGSFADWNAQEGEAGCIENKPAFVEKLQTYSIDYSNEERGLLPIEIQMDNVIHFIAKSQSPAYQDLYFSVKINQDYTTITGMGIYPFKIKIQYGRIYAMLTRQNDPTQEIIALKVVDFNESSLNNNVITTFKQELSDADKNQALANLGIGFIKYLISPHIIKRNDSEIPQDLNQILWGMKNYPLNFVNNLMVCYVIYDDESIHYDPITLEYHEYDDGVNAEAFEFRFYDDGVYILSDGTLKWM